MGDGCSSANVESVRFSEISPLKSKITLHYSSIFDNAILSGLEKQTETSQLYQKMNCQVKMGQKDPKRLKLGEIRLYFHDRTFPTDSNALPNQAAAAPAGPRAARPRPCQAGRLPVNEA